MVNNKKFTINIIKYCEDWKAKISQRHKSILIQRKNIIIKLQRILCINSNNIMEYININEKDSLFDELKFYRLIEKAKLFIKNYLGKCRIKKIF